jgi:hypothetical protein
MLKKIRRRKPRNNFTLDRVYCGLMIELTCGTDRRAVIENKIAGPLFADDRFVHMLIQKEKQIYNKLLHYKTNRLFPFFPSFIPVQSKEMVFSLSEFYWTFNTIKYPCIYCEKPTFAFLYDHSVKNAMCGKCIYTQTHKSNKKLIFNKRKHNPENSKHHLAFFDYLKKHHNRVFDKLVQRERRLLTKNKRLTKSEIKNIKTKLSMLSNLMKTIVKTN